ncbi:hypothetical protein CRU94_04150 [Arcobacter sp. AHV-9/2010]|uniref:DUF748 domain-containing protein n=1 Tax=Arcobacter sp. AHV-9/2010 TaxID=2021861 RepID=UPI00100A5374|nr:DUF748 domain-containing protein [Arcobacter sp. CECT 9299]RXJ95811.1 hypothetical protein CRU94_04150 [Arcobacter sp. CECT 9299]
MKKIAKILGALIVFYLLLGFFLVPFIAKKLIISNLDKTLITTTKIDKIYFNPISFELNIKNFALVYEEDTLFSFKNLYIDIANLKSLQERHLRVRDISLDEAYINIIDKEGNINFANLLKDKKESKKSLDNQEESENSFDFFIYKISLKNSKINYTKFVNDEKFNINLKDLNYTIYDFGTFKNYLSSNNLEAIINQNSKLSIKAGIKLNPLIIDGQIKIDDLKINDILAFDKKLFNFKINDESNINLILNYNINLEDSLKLKLFSKLFEINNTKVIKDDDEILYLNKFAVEDTNIDLDLKNIDINLIKFDDLTTNMILNKDGSNFSNLINSKKEENQKEIEEEKNEDDKSWDFKISNLNIDNLNYNLVDNVTKSSLKIDSLNLNTKDIDFINSSFDFKSLDFNILNLNFTNENIIFHTKSNSTTDKFETDLSNIKGSIVPKNKLYQFDLDAIVDRYGVLNSKNILNIHDFKESSDIKLILKNINMGKFSTYSSKYLGRKLDGGRLDLNLDYDIKNSNLKAKNELIIKNIEFTDSVASQNSVVLPLDLAVVLLEDLSKTIDINLPVSGNISNPQFSLAKIIWKSFLNLMTKVATAPFSLVASMFDFSEDEIKSVNFAKNEHEITPVQKETLDKIAIILNSKKELGINFSASFNEKEESEEHSTLRALNIKEYLIKEKSVDERQILIDNQSVKTKSDIDLNIKLLK